MTYKQQPPNSHAGFTLLEVVLAIAVFAFGLLALIELQTGIARSGSDANLRTVAASVAEEIVEGARGFSTIDEYDAIASFGDPDGTTYSVLRDEGEGVGFTVNMLVQDYYWDGDTETFVTTAPEGIVRSDYKSMDIVVMWRDLDASEGETFTDHDSINFGGLGGGIRLVETVPSSPPVLGALVASSRDLLGGPQVTYFPGENPDIIRLTLDADGGKFKEATTPEPDVIRTSRT